MSKRPGQSKMGKGGLGCAILFLLPFGVMGSFAFYQGLLEFSKEGLGEGAIVGAVVGGLFMLVGFGGICATFWANGLSDRESEALERGELAFSWRESKNFPKLKQGRGPRLGISLPPENTALGNMIGLWICSILWNGISWFALYHTWDEGWFPAIFLSIFCLVGLLLFGGAVQQTLKFFMVGQTVLEVDAEPVAPGQKLEWRVYQRGDFEIERASAKLICKEKVQYQRGTNTVTHEEIVFEETMAEETGLRAHSSAPVMIGEHVIPEDAPHSFTANRNNIIWAIKINLVLPGRPDVDDTFPFRVSPEVGGR